MQNKRTAKPSDAVFAAGYSELVPHGASLRMNAAVTKLEPHARALMDYWRASHPPTNVFYISDPGAP